ncbi:MAG: hypothetical protein SFY66_07955 [Oculatellaceae cyanobacterium bins.114]|nr:hypothetical protein [Oculatellaceae cyanobacterium bins.114]
MLPPVIDEEKLFPFKFWFNNSIQDGMFYRNELFYRLHSIDIRNRARLYHYACRIAQRDSVVVSATDVSCSIWVSLRSSHAQASTLHNHRLPSFMELIQEIED